MHIHSHDSLCMCVEAGAEQRQHGHLLDLVCVGCYKEINSVTSGTINKMGVTSVGNLVELIINKN